VENGNGERVRSGEYEKEGKGITLCLGSRFIVCAAPKFFSRHILGSATKVEFLLVSINSPPKSSSLVWL
jgi:hypothetical protein